LKSQRISHTHLQFAKATTQGKIAKEYVLPTLSAGWKIKYENTTKCKRNCGFSAKFKVRIFIQNLVLN
jgi:hypothetical protein